MKADAFGTSGGSLSGERFPEKYVVLHHLSVNITRNFNIGFFESIAYSREDSTGNDNLDLNYLNPIIFYRAIEQQNGSIDNALLGMDFSWITKNRFLFYGQLVIDEFKFDEFTSGNGWWGNKFAIQLGAKYIDALNIPNLDLQLEYNTARPYTYSHNNIFNNYAHYRQPLSHPLGANFKEVVALIQYQPIGKLNITGKLIFSSYGADTTNTNFGSNILLDNNTRVQDFNNEIGQGFDTNVVFVDITATYHLRQNLFLDGQLVFRELSSAISNNNQENLYLALSIRLNIPKRLHEF